MGTFKYTNDHECIHIEGDTAWVGISPYAREALGDLVYVEFPEAGKRFTKGETLAVVESVKTAAEVYSPLDGEVTAVNDALGDDMELISSAVNDKGWIVKLKISDASQAEGLMDETQYKEYLKTVD